MSVLALVLVLQLILSAEISYGSELSELQQPWVESLCSWTLGMLVVVASMLELANLALVNLED